MRGDAMTMTTGDGHPGGPGWRPPAGRPAPWPAPPAPARPQPHPPAPPSARGSLCRVSIEHAGRVIDLSIPAEVPVAGLIGQLAVACGLRLDVPQPHPPVLVRPVRGPIPMDSSLARAGVVDGELLVLTSMPVTPPRVVDDLSESIGAAVRERPGHWSPGATLRALRWVAVGTSAAAALASLAAAAPVPVPLPLAVAAILLGLGLLLRLGRLGAGTAGTLAAAAVPWAALAAVRLAGMPDGLADPGSLAVAAAGAAAGAAVGTGVAQEFVRPALACAIVAVAAGAAGVAHGFGFTVEQTGAGVVVAGLVLLVTLPRMVTASSGLGDLGEGSEHDEVVARVDGGRRLLAWLLAATGLVLLAAVAALSLDHGTGPSGRALAAICCLALLLRARTWRFTAEVVPLVAAGAAGALLMAGSLVAGFGLTALAGAATAGAAVVALAGLRLERPAQRRPLAGKVVEVIDLLCLLAVVPVALASTGVFGQVAELVAGVVQ